MKRDQRYYMYMTAVTAVVLACVGAFFLYRNQTAPAQNSAGGFSAFAFDASTSAPSVSAEPNSSQPPSGTKEYQNAEYGFSLYYPQDLTVAEHPEPSNSIVITFQDRAQSEGFQIFVTPYTQAKITQARFQMDEPSGVMNAPQNITIDGAAATEFFSTNQAMGATREIWFLHGGWLYEVTAPEPLDSWLLSIMQTWQFI